MRYLEFGSCLHCLPFVKPRAKPHASRFGGHLNHWAVPDVGGYAAGCSVGAGMAEALLVHLRDSQRRGRWQAPALSCMLVDLLEQTGRLSDSRRGQVVGLAGHLERWLMAAVRELGSKLDGVQDATIEGMLNAGIKAAREATAPGLTPRQNVGKSQQTTGRVPKSKAVRR